jgi:hypothetical protein
MTMKIVKHKLSLPVMNLDKMVESDGDNENQNRRHGILFPNSMRTLICGPCNCGKSNVMLSLLFAENGLRFKNVYVYSKSLYQPKYKYLHTVFKNLKEIGYYPYKENDEIITAKDAKESSVFIFDDVACDNQGQGKIREYYCIGRHKAIAVFYLCQTYTRIPKHLIRDNANFIILFKQDDVNLKHVYQEHVGADMSFDKFKSLCAECWKIRYDFLTIDKDSDINKGRYRKNLDNIILISSN